MSDHEDPYYYYYGERYEQSGCPNLVHAVGVGGVGAVAACGHVMVDADRKVVSTETVSCIRCWGRALKYPKLIEW